MRIGIAAAIAAVCVLAAIGVWTLLAPERPSSATPTETPTARVEQAAGRLPAPPAPDEIAELRQQLIQEIEQRTALTREVATLRDEVAELLSASAKDVARPLVGAPVHQSRAVPNTVRFHVAIGLFNPHVRGPPRSRRAA